MKMFLGRRKRLKQKWQIRVRGKEGKLFHYSLLCQIYIMYVNVHLLVCLWCIVRYILLFIILTTIYYIRYMWCLLSIWIYSVLLWDSNNLHYFMSNIKNHYEFTLNELILCIVQNPVNWTLRIDVLTII
jgi:hypothetical protein